MKAVICERYGPPDVLQLKEVERPTPAENEVLVKVHATTVNRTDSALIRAIPFFSRFFTGLFKPKRPIPGTDFAGQIKSVGKEVSSFELGDRVFGFNEFGWGAHAQYMTIGQDGALLTIPDDLSYQQAVACCEGAYYALNFLNKVKIEKGQKVLVNGGTGAIGSALVQLLKYHEVDVTAVCEGKNEKLVLGLGASRIIDYTKEDFTTDDQSYSYVFDAIGKSSFGKCKPLLQPGGVYMSADLGPWAENIYLPFLTKLYGDKKVRFPMPADCPGCLGLVKKLMEEGKFKAVIDRTYPFEQIVEAYRYVGMGNKTGNVVITVDHDNDV